VKPRSKKNLQLWPCKSKQKRNKCNKESNYQNKKRKPEITRLKIIPEFERHHDEDTSLSEVRPPPVLDPYDKFMIEQD
jgi:hypothetical protein